MYVAETIISITKAFLALSASKHLTTIIPITLILISTIIHNPKRFHINARRYARNIHLNIFVISEKIKIIHADVSNSFPIS